MCVSRSLRIQGVSCFVVCGNGPMIPSAPGTPILCTCSMRVCVLCAHWQAGVRSAIPAVVAFTIASTGPVVSILAQPAPQCGLPNALFTLQARWSPNNGSAVASGDSVGAIAPAAQFEVLLPTATTWMSVCAAASAGAVLSSDACVGNGSCTGAGCNYTYTVPAGRSGQYTLQFRATVAGASGAVVPVSWSYVVCTAEYVTRPGVCHPHATVHAHRPSLSLSLALSLTLSHSLSLTLTLALTLALTLFVALLTRAFRSFPVALQAICDSGPRRKLCSDVLTLSRGTVHVCRNAPTRQVTAPPPFLLNCVLLAAHVMLRQGGNCFPANSDVTLQDSIVAQQGWWAADNSDGLTFYECPIQSVRCPLSCPLSGGCVIQAWNCVTLVARGRMYPERGLPSSWCVVDLLCDVAAVLSGVFTRQRRER